MLTLEKHYKALANCIRIDICYLLLCKGELSIDSIVWQLKLPYETVFRHLAVLRNSGFIESRTYESKAFFKVNASCTHETKYLLALVKERHKVRRSR